MSSEYPDVLGDLVDARQRFEVNGVHYVAALEPAIIYPGETTSLQIWLQSCWDVPVDFVVSVHLPPQQPAAFSVTRSRPLGTSNRLLADQCTPRAAKSFSQS